MDLSRGRTRRRVRTVVTAAEGSAASRSGARGSGASGSGLRIAACAKWVDLRPGVDALTGRVSTDERRFGFSAADAAALEVALRLGSEWGAEVDVVVAAPAPAEGAIRSLAAAGASRAIRVDLPSGASSKQVAASLAAATADADVVVCGDYSLDVGSGSVPASIAHRRGAAQALGLISVTPESPGVVRAVRRLDGGRREHLRVRTPAVLSVEGSVATLRRAPLRSLRAGHAPAVEVIDPVGLAVASVRLDRTEPVRPRARELPGPNGSAAFDRVVELTGALVARTPPRRVDAADDADAAADAIIEQLAAWGYLDPS